MGDRERLAQLGTEVLDGTGLTAVPMGMIRTDGGLFPAELSSLAVYDDSGEAAGQVIVGRDISQRKRLDDTLRYQATLLSNVLDAVISTDMEFIVRSWNNAAERIYGWTGHEALGNPLYQLIHHAYVGETEEEMRRQFRSGGSWRGEAIHTAQRRLAADRSIVRFSDQGRAG